MKKIIYVLLFLLPINGAFAMGNKPADEKKEFRFEDYENAEEAEAALLKLHPIGSSIDSIKSTLENAGAECNFISKDKIIDKIDKEEDYLFCSYNKPFLIFLYEWRIIIYPSFRDKEKIKGIKVHKFFHTI